MKLLTSFHAKAGAVMRKTHSEDCSIQRAEINLRSSSGDKTLLNRTSRSPHPLPTSWFWLVSNYCRHILSLSLSRVCWTWDYANDSRFINAQFNRGIGEKGLAGDNCKMLVEDVADVIGISVVFDLTFINASQGESMSQIRIIYP